MNRPASQVPRKAQIIEGLERLGELALKEGFEFVILVARGKHLAYLFTPPDEADPYGVIYLSRPEVEQFAAETADTFGWTRQWLREIVPFYFKEDLILTGLKLYAVEPEYLYVMKTMVKFPSEIDDFDTNVLELILDFKTENEGADLLKKYICDISARPRLEYPDLTIRQISRYLKIGNEFNILLGIFLDRFYRRETSERKAMIQDAPESDLPKEYYSPFLAATAHKLANDYDLPVPEWVHQPEFFLDESRPYFSLRQSGKYTAKFIEQTPPEFKMRNLFISKLALTRV